MLTFLKENLGAIIILIVLVGIVSFITVKLIRAKKQGKTSCGCGCQHCAMNGKCHAKKEQEKLKKPE